MPQYKGRNGLDLKWLVMFVKLLRVSTVGENGSYKVKAAIVFEPFDMGGLFRTNPTNIEFVKLRPLSLSSSSAPLCGV